MMTQYIPQSNAHSISELTILKISALILLIFVHSDLVTAYPAIMNPVDWFLLSIFFFIGGYLAYTSFQKREKSLTQFFKSKILSLYVPFAVAVIFYLALDTLMGAQTQPIALFSQLSMLNIFSSLNTVYNWGTLWFIPFMLLFMGITCMLERYVKNIKLQLTAIAALLIVTTLLGIYNAPLRVDGLFNQYLLVFVFGFYISKFRLYDKLLNYKTAFIAVPIVLFFSVDLSYLFNYDTAVNALVAQFYFNCRCMMLSMGLVILALMTLRRIKLPVNGLAKQIADHSAFIYLSEPFISFLILTYVFGMGESMFAGGIAFYLYQAVRIVVLLVGIPLAFLAWRYVPKMISPSFMVKMRVVKMRVFYRGRNTLFK